MASEGFITESQRHFGKDDSIICNNDLSLAAVFDFRKTGKVEAHLFALLGYQHIEVFDVLGGFQKKRSAQFLLQHLAGGLQQASPRGDGIAWKMGLIHRMSGVAAQRCREAGVGVVNGF